jgi:hypothetical protein
MRGRALAATLLLLVASTCARATIWERPLGPYGVFRVDLPSGWTAKLQEPDAAGGRAIAITPPTGVPLLLLVSTFPLPDNVADTLLEDGARSTVARLQSIAEEPALEAKRFEGAISRGFYVSATDRRVREPTAQNFKYGIQGHLVTGRLFATFSVFTNLPSGAERDRALEIVRAAWHEPTTMPVLDNKGTVSLALPDRAWRLLVDLPGFAFEPRQSLPAQQGVRLAGSNASTGMNVTAFLQAAVRGRTAVDYREQVWARIQPTGPFTDVRRSERDGMALLERTFPGPAGLRIDQRHVNAHVVRDGVWLDVHLSKPRYTTADDALFDAIIRTVRFANKGIADVDYDAAVLRLEPSTALAYFGRASVYFKHREYDKAIADFTQVVRLEPDFAGSYKGRALAYRRKGELDRAVADYDQIIRLEPNETLGYFGRGSIHQERGELDRAIADFDDVIRLDPKHAFAFEQRGRAYEHKGERDKAIADYRMVLALVTMGPLHQRAREGLTRLGASP